MKFAMTQEVQKMFSAIAPRYDRLNHLLSFQVDRWWRREAVQLLNGANRVIDLCAGTLDLSIQLAKQSPATRIDAVDFSQEMLNHGETKLDAALKDTIKTHCGDVQTLPFPDQSYDGAMVAYGMRNVDDNVTALQEVFRVLRPGGRMVILEFFRPEKWGAKLFHATYGRFVMPLLGGVVSGNRQAYAYLRDSIQGFQTVSAYQELIQACGFEDVTYKHQWGGASTLIQGRKP